MDTLFSDAFERLLADVCEPAAVRQIEAGGDYTAMWRALDEGGFPNLLAPETHEGAGLALIDAAPLVALCGRYALPLPLAYTMLARAWLAQTDTPVPPGSITIASHALVQDEEGWRAPQVPFGMTSDWVLVSHEGVCSLWPVEAQNRVPDGIHASLDATLAWARAPKEPLALPSLGTGDMRDGGAALTAMMMTGALERILDLSITYANDRTQFGRPIGKFQAIQQQISVLAEWTFAARMAAKLACPRDGFMPTRNGTAIAKSYASEVAAPAAATAHAVHGAIGITAEHDLHLYTRRLHAWRRAFGSESAWHERLGQAWLEGDDSALDFIRAGHDPDIVSA